MREGKAGGRSRGFRQLNAFVILIPCWALRKGLTYFSMFYYNFALSVGILSVLVLAVVFTWSVIIRFIFKG